LAVAVAVEAVATTSTVLAVAVLAVLRVAQYMPVLVVVPPVALAVGLEGPVLMVVLPLLLIRARSIITAQGVAVVAFSPAVAVVLALDNLALT
jgi:hypothetical protein